MAEDTVKVRLATARPTPEGTELVLHTIDGPEVTFLLDDLATTLLGVTMSTVYHEIKGRVKPGDKDTYKLFEREGSSSE